MPDPTYRDAVRSAWHFTSKHTIFLLFGFFAVFVGQMGLVDVAMKLAYVSPERSFFTWWMIMPEFIGSPFSLINHLSLPMNSWVAVALFFTVMMSVCLLLMFTAIVSHGALVYASSRSFRRVGVTPHAGVAWRVGVSHFWRLLFLQIIRKGALFILAMVLAFALFNGMVDATAFDLILFITLFTLAMIVGMVLSFLAVYATGYIVVEEYRLGEACHMAWKLFRRHMLVSLEVGLLLLILEILVSAVVLSAFVILFIPTVFLWTTVTVFLPAPFYVMSIFVAALIFILFLAFCGAGLTVFTTSAWTFLFMRMHKHGIASRILHLAKGHR
jgi:hypothetical protein